jgi:hypothetical protein
MQSVSKQRIGKHALMEAVFYIRSVQGGYKEVFDWRSNSANPIPLAVNRQS